MSLQSRLEALATRVGAEIKALRAEEVARVRSLEAHDFSMVGTLTVKVGNGRIPIIGGTFTITNVAARVTTAPTGASVLIDVNKNGTTIYGTQSNRPTIAAAGTLATVGSHSVTTVTDGDYLSVDVDQIGSTVAGADLVVTIRLLRTA